MLPYARFLLSDVGGMLLTSALVVLQIFALGGVLFALTPLFKIDIVSVVAKFIGIETKLHYADNHPDYLATMSSGRPVAKNVLDSNSKALCIRQLTIPWKWPQELLNLRRKLGFRSPPSPFIVIHLACNSIIQHFFYDSLLLGLVPFGIIANMINLTRLLPVFFQQNRQNIPLLISMLSGLSVISSHRHMGVVFGLFYGTWIAFKAVDNWRRNCAQFFGETIARYQP